MATIDVNILLQRFGTVGYRPTTQDFINLIELIIGAGDSSGLVTIEMLSGMIGLAQPGDAADAMPPLRLAINTTPNAVAYTNYVGSNNQPISLPPMTIGILAYNGTAWAFNGYNVTGITGVLSNLQTTDKTNLVAAINELVNNLGDLSQLQTGNKDNIVNSVNDLYSLIQNGATVLLPQGQSYYDVPDGVIIEKIWCQITTYTDGISVGTANGGNDIYKQEQPDGNGNILLTGDRPFRTAQRIYLTGIQPDTITLIYKR